MTKLYESTDKRHFLNVWQIRPLCSIILITLKNGYCTNRSTKLDVLQKEFCKQFPFLKIEFSALPSKGEKKGEGIENNLKNKTLGQFNKSKTPFNFLLSPSTTVNELENLFVTLLNMHVLVYRKSGSVWVKTTITDGWSLYEQNKQGEHINKIYNNEQEPGEE